MSFLLSLVLSTKSESKRVESFLSESGGRGKREKAGSGVAQTMYTHVSKCKYDKIKKRKTHT
jgi:hypothetical protein